MKKFPKGIHSGDRYIRTFPDTPENAAWGEAYRARSTTNMPTNWSWENATAAMHFLVEALKATNSELRRQQARRGAHGHEDQVAVRHRRHDDHACRGHTIVGYAIGWGTIDQSEGPLRHRRQELADGSRILELEAEWKKKAGLRLAS